MLGAPFVGPSRLMTTSQWYKPLSISHVEISNCVSSPLKNPSGAPVIVSDNVKVFVTLTFVVIVSYLQYYLIQSDTFRIRGYDSNHILSFS